jgi:enolase
MKNSAITEIRARELLDSRGRPMVEVDVVTAGEIVGTAAAPCGSSVGSHEVTVLRDGNKRYAGLGVRKAVKNVTDVIAPALSGWDVFDQPGVDRAMINLDGTPNKSLLGANAIYSVSLAVARAAAQVSGLPLYRYLGGVQATVLPRPMFNMINGGQYGSVHMPIQEFLLIPSTVTTYGEALRCSVEVFYHLAQVIEQRFGEDHLFIGESMGYGAPSEDPAVIIETLLEAVAGAGYAGAFRVGLDCAASHFYAADSARYLVSGEKVARAEWVERLDKLVRAYDLLSIEDPLQEDDWEGFAEVTRRWPELIVVGDDLFVTSVERLRQGVALGAGNAMVFKPNMVGTLSEAMDAARFARAHGFTLVPSGRAGGTQDDPIPEIAVAVGAPLAKCGAPRSGERTAHHNRLLRIEEELGAAGVLAEML